MKADEEIVMYQRKSEKFCNIPLPEQLTKSTSCNCFVLYSVTAYQEVSATAYRGVYRTLSNI